MLSNKRREIAELVGERIGYKIFVMMLNPKYRGPNFTWQRLESMVMDLASGQVGLAGNFGKDLKEMKVVARDSAKRVLSGCFEDSDVQNWLMIKSKTSQQ